MWIYGFHRMPRKVGYMFVHKYSVNMGLLAFTRALEFESVRMHRRPVDIWRSHAILRHSIFYWILFSILLWFYYLIWFPKKYKNSPRNTYFYFLTTCKLSAILFIWPNECPVSYRCFTNLNVNFGIWKTEDIHYISFGMIFLFVQCISSRSMEKCTGKYQVC